MCIRDSVEGVGPGGAPALVVGNGESMDLVDAGCLQLGADGQDFSVSMWLKASGGSQIIGTKTQYNGNQGFVVFTTVRSDGQLELRARSALASDQPSSTWRTVTSIPFTPDVWTHVAVTYRNDDALSTFTLHVNTAPTSGAAHPDVHNSDLRIGDQGWGDISPFEVSEMRSYGRLLTDAEVGSLFIAGAADAGFTTAPLLEGISALEQHVTGQPVR